MRENTDDAIEVIDTAYLSIFARAAEAARPDALIIDHLAARFIDHTHIARSRLAALLGNGGDLIVVRSLMLDKLILSLVREHGVRDLINVGAGFDTRPYRMSFPDQFRIVEVDDPMIIRCKEIVLADQTTTVQVQRHAVDLTDAGWFSELIEQIPDIDTTAVIAEGLFPYLDSCEVRTLVEELAASGRCRYLMVDLISLDTARYLRTAGQRVGAELDFHAMEDLKAFRDAGWRCLDYWPMMVALRQYRPKSPIAAMMPTTVASDAKGGLIDGVAIFEHL